MAVIESSREFVPFGKNGMFLLVSDAEIDVLPTVHIDDIAGKVFTLVMQTRNSGVYKRESL